MRQAKINDARSQPAYPLAEASRYLKIAPATLRSWVAGRRYPKTGGTGRFHPLIHPAIEQPPILSFWNLIEAHVLRSLRTEHGVSMDALRKALAYAEKTLNIKRLLLSRELRTSAGRMLLDRYGKLIDLSASGQIAMRRMFEDHLLRVEWGESEFPVRLYPFPFRVTSAVERSIAIDPQVAFGRPVVANKGISTAAITDRIDAGEKLAALAADYDLSEFELEQAILYERAA
jgi:uncharacterized protein (DUF433 family)